MVRARDGDRCQLCGGGPDFDHALEAAHVYSRGAHPALKYEVDNGLQLGRSCHRRAHLHEQRFHAWFARLWPDRAARLQSLERSMA